MRKLLKDYFSEAKEWYDGYHFGNADIYCPWDVINYVEHLRYDSEADQTTKDEIEQLIAGEILCTRKSQRCSRSIDKYLCGNDQYFGYKSKERRKGKLLSWNDVRAFKKSQKLDRKIKC